MEKSQNLIHSCSLFSWNRENECLQNMAPEFFVKIKYAQKLVRIKVHVQLINRVIITTTE